MKFLRAHGTKYHYITKDGYVYSDIDKRIVNENQNSGNHMIKIVEDGILTIISIEKLLMYTFYGKIELPIINMKPKQDIHIKHLKYYYTKTIVDGDKIYLDGVEFRQHPIHLDIYFNRSGAAYLHQYNKQMIVRWKFPIEYPTIQINRKKYRVHRLVYETFVGEIPDKMIINHIDLMKGNPDITNLELATVAENNKHSRFHNLENYWSDETVHRICELLESNIHIKDISMDLGYYNYKDICRSNRRITDILNGVYYTDISKDYDFSRYIKYQGRKMSEWDRDDRIHEVCKLLSPDHDLSDLDISRLTKVPATTVRYIRLGKNGKWSRRISDLYDIDSRVRKSGYFELKLDRNDIMGIRKLFKKNILNKDIAKIYDVSEETIRRIKVGKAYTNIT